jgi:hypothetical protein
MSDSIHLFSTDEWSIFAAHQRSLLEQEIGIMNEEMLLNTSIHDLCNYFAEKYKIRVPTLLKDKIVVDQREAQIDISYDRTRYVKDRNRPLMVPGTLVEVSVPFEGDPQCFSVQPTTHTFYRPHGGVQDNILLLYIKGLDLNADMVRAQIQQSITEISQNLNYLQIDANRFNGNLYSYAHTLLGQRRKKLLTDRNLVSALGYKLKGRSSDSSTDEAPEARRKLAPLLPTVSTIPFKPEPTLTLKDYERILKVLMNTVGLLEHSPSLFVSLDEETLRSHFLVQLNRHFEGKVQGETFTFEGKTDIFIRTQGKNIFIVECKRWSGSMILVETLNQLLGYASWRDTKAVLIVFNRNNEFAQMIISIRETLKSHSNFKRELPQLSETTFPYLFAHRDDRNREMLLTILAVDVPKSQVN